MASEPEAPPDDPLGLQRLEREIHIEKLRQDIKEVTGEELLPGNPRDNGPGAQPQPEALLSYTPPPERTPTPKPPLQPTAITDTLTARAPGHCNTATPSLNAEPNENNREPVEGNSRGGNLLHFYCTPS